MKALPSSRTLACLAAGLSASAASAQDAYQSLAPLTIVGSQEAAWLLPGSAAFLEAVEFRSRGHTNLRQVAARVPGVYVRDEDGFGNFPNISIRGVDGSRSQKVTIMEDGILTAPSPYAAPAAYYTPRSGRMAGIEFLKGSSQVRYGPQTTGGVVNFLSTPVPADSRFFSRSTYGSFNTLYNHTWYGNTVETEAGRVGYLLEFHGQTSDGFRDIDGGGADSGFDLYEPMLKFFWEPATALRQRIELKAGFTHFDADETYTGVTEADLRQNPDRRYAGSRFDHIDSEHFRSYLKWVGEPSEALRLESAVYFNSFRRTWDKVNELSGPGVRTNVGQALMHAPSVAVLQGLGAGNVITRAAFRDHESYGWQNQANIRFDTAELQHDVAVGLRVHRDQIRATDQNTAYASNLAGGFLPGVRGPVNRGDSAAVTATAVYLEDNIRIGRFSVRPGVRYEWLEWDHWNRTTGSASGSEYLLMGGIGANYEIDDCNSLFGGIYRGASPSNPGGYRQGTDSEKSTGIELGYRHRHEATRWEIVGFHTEFRDLIAPEVGIGGGGVAPSRNAGGAVSWGFEALASHDLGHKAAHGFGIPVFASATYTNAEFKNISGARLGNAAGLFAGATNGDELPYIPEWKLAAGIGLNRELWSVTLDASFNSSTWGTGYNARPRVNDNGTPANQSAIDGKIGSLLLFDLNGHYQLTDNFRVVGGIHNLFDEREIISRAPLGPRANSPRMIYAGIEAEF